MDLLKWSTLQLGEGLDTRPPIELEMKGCTFERDS